MRTVTGIAGGARFGPGTFTFHIAESWLDVLRLLLVRGHWHRIITGELCKVVR